MLFVIEGVPGLVVTVQSFAAGAIVTPCSENVVVAGVQLVSSRKLMKNTTKKQHSKTLCVTPVY